MIAALIPPLLGLALGAALPIVFAPLIEARLPVPAVFAIHPGPLAEAALYGILAALLFTLWPLARTEEIRPAALFRDAALRGAGWPRAIWVGVTLLILAALVALASVAASASSSRARSSSSGASSAWASSSTAA